MYGSLELGSAVSGENWLTGRELGTGERWMRGLLSPLDIVPGGAGLKKFGTSVRLGNQAIDLGQMAAKPGLRSTIQREMLHVGDKGKVHIPVENTHFFENKAKQMFSKAEDIGGNLGLIDSAASPNAFKNQINEILEKYNWEVETFQKKP